MPPKTIALTALSVAVLLSSGLVAQGVPADGKVEDSGQAIEYLIQAIAKSQLTFIRNGESYSSADAVKHVRTKYAYFKFRIKTPEDFIRLCAAKSLVSGEPYLVVTQRGTVSAETWLKQLLEEYRKTQEGSAIP